MSHRIPVFFLPIERSKLPEKLATWHSVESILSERWEQRIEFGMRTSTSRNWIHQGTLDQICKGLNIEGLEFILSEVICLDTNQLKAAAHGLDRALSETADGIPDLGPDEVDHGYAWWLRHDIENGAEVEFPAEFMRKAFDEAQASFDVDPAKDVGFEAVVGFYSFVKSLRAAVDEALTQKVHLLYVQPQP